MVTDVLETPLAVIAVADGARLRFLGEVGFGLGEMPLSASLLMPHLGRSELFCLLDAEAEPQFRLHPLVADGPRLRYIAATPLLAPDGEVIGYVAGFDTAARRSGPTEAQRRLLSGLARQALALLAAQGRERAASGAEGEGAAQTHLLWATEHDPLTGLANRRLFAKRLEAAVRRAERDQTQVGLLLFDLDRLKQVNDTFGHAAGDFLLNSFVERLARVRREGDTLARLGGDEFALIMPDLEDRQPVLDLARSVLGRMHEPLGFGGKSLRCQASIGASFYPAHGRDANSLQRNADVALNRAKAQGRCRLVVFEAEMRSELQLHSSMLEMARQALQSDGIMPYYQPKITLGTGKLAGFEALLRWQHPRRGIQGPGQIAAAFADPDLAEAISVRMFALVAARMRAWLEAGLAFGHVGVNASAAEFLREGFAERVLGQLQEAGVPPQHLELEVTESVLLGDQADHADRMLRTLSEAGVRIALDDFGTGFASLTHLKRFPVNTIKIDQSFVRDLGTDMGGGAIIQAVIGLGQNLGMTVVAEGVETEEQFLFLQRHRCHVGQGFFFGRPADAASAEALLTAGLTAGI